MGIETYVMDARKCAERIGLSDTAVSRLCRVGKLKGFQNARKGNWCITVDNFIDFLYKNPKYTVRYLQNDVTGFNGILKEHVTSELAKRPPLYSGKDLELLFDVTTQSIYYWVKGGILTPLGTTTYRSYLFSEENVVSAVQQNMNLFSRLRDKRFENYLDPRLNNLRDLCLKEEQHAKRISKNYD